MMYHRGKQIKVVSATTAFDFESKLNSALKALNEKGIKYELQVTPTAGFVAYIIYEEQTQVPENVRDEYEMSGETHTCIECPFYIRPTDGRVKYTKCPKINKLRSRGDHCCDQFYDLLAAGRIELVEVG